MAITAKFNLQDQKEFFRTLKERVNNYFAETKRSRFGNAQLYWKTAAMLSIYFVPFALILTGILPFWANWMLYAVMGIGMAGIGMSIMHDAVHGSYSSKRVVNKIFGYSMELMGGSSFNWMVQHNVIHHTYTNIPGIDEDITGKPILRLEPTSKWMKIHRFQHYYALPLYTLLTFSWIVWGDFFQLFRYNRMGMTEQVGSRSTKEFLILLVSKSIYFCIQFVIPILVLGLSWWVVLIGFVIMHMFAGFILAVVFQLAHVVEETEYPLPDVDGNIENSWAVHQLQTTANFAKGRKLLSWFVGGLNYQIEHHLFPNISHIHYPNLSKIVKQTAQEFQLPYNEFKSVRAAVYSHLKHLKELGQKPSMV